MFEIRAGQEGEIIPSGRFDATQAEYVSNFLAEVTESTTMDFRELEYISSAGLGVLVATQQRLNETGQSLRIVNAKSNIMEVFSFSGLDQLFEIEGS